MITGVMQEAAGQIPIGVFLNNCSAVLFGHMTEIKIDSVFFVYLIIHFSTLTQIVPPLHLSDH